MLHSPHRGEAERGVRLLPRRTILPAWDALACPFGWQASTPLSGTREALPLQYWEGISCEQWHW